MRVFVARTFGRWADRERISDATLAAAASQLVAGSYDADLGGLLFKMRIARRGGGKSGGFRTIVGFRRVGSGRIVFLFGFAKNDRDNLSDTELRALAGLARSFIDADERSLENLLRSDVYRELEVGE